MPVLASSWSGLNLIRGHFMVQKPQSSHVRVLQPPEKADSIQTACGERSVNHVNFQTPAGDCLGQVLVAWAKNCARDNSNNRKQILEAQNYFTIVDAYFKTFPSVYNRKPYWISFIPGLFTFFL